MNQAKAQIMDFDVVYSSHTQKEANDDGQKSWLCRESLPTG
jgi:hypothetical protein